MNEKLFGPDAHRPFDEGPMRLEGTTVVIPGTEDGIGMVVRQTPGGGVAVDLGVAADPVAWTREIIDEERGHMHETAWAKEYGLDFDACPEDRPKGA